jgi:tetratricopeptide (TPR) repeat protein
MNNEDAQRALTYHNEALSIFESLDDTRGLADTHDLLGMSNLMGSNFAQATAQYQRALELYTALGDRRGIAAISGAIVLQAPSLQSDMLVLSAPLEPPEETLAHVRPMTQELGWRAQEAVVLWALAERFASAGSYGRAFEIAEQAIELAREIGHDQWLTAATAVHGAIFADLLDFEDARHELELALDVARRINSVHWVRVTAGFLASTLIGAHDFARAREILDEFVPPTLPATTLGQRQGWMARAELALAQNEPARAMEVLDLLLREAANLAPGRVIPRLWMLRAQALLQLDRADAAETFALEARANLEELSQPRLMWRVLAVLAQIYRSQQRKEALTNAEAAAQAIVDQLAVTVPDETLRATFLSCATKEIRGG